MSVRLNLMTQIEQIYDGEWVEPKMDGWLCVCCGCGLVHRFEFGVRREGAKNHVRFRAWRVSACKGRGKGRKRQSR